MRGQSAMPRSTRTSCARRHTSSPARSTSSTSTIPSSLCASPSRCEKSVIITHSKEKITRTNFYAGGVLYQAASGIYLAEADVRPTPLTVPVYPRAGAEYRIVDGRLIVRDGGALYEISGF